MKRFIAIILAITAVFSITWCASVAGAQTRQQPAADDYIECGVCGAHVHDWWYIGKDDADTSPFIEVCQFCYLDAIAEDADSAR